MLLCERLRDVCDSQQKLDHACTCFAFVSVVFMCRCWVKKTNQKNLQQYDFIISNPKVFRFSIAKVLEKALKIRVLLDLVEG